MIAGIWWRCQALPFCNACGTELHVTHERAGLHFSCEACGLQMRRTIQPSLLLQAVFEIMAEQIAAENGVPLRLPDTERNAPPRFQTAEEPAAASPPHYNLEMQQPSLHRTLLPGDS